MVSESPRETPHGLDKSQGSLTSWLIPDQVHSTRLLDINDEVLEVNGIEVSE